MSFYFKEKKMYNMDTKKRYINKKYAKNTQTYIIYLFYKTNELESQINKDVYEMNEKELESLLRGLKNKSYKSIATSRSILSSYIDWATFEEKLNDTGINLLKTLPQFQGKNLEQFISKVAIKKKYIDKYDLEDMEISALNPQDIVVPWLLWEGVKGEKLIEIQELTIHDLRPNNKLYIKSRNKEIKISNELVELIKDAHNKKEYHKYNINEGGKIKSTTANLRDSEHIVRGTNRSENDYISYVTILQRLRKLIKEWDNTSQVTAEKIWMSGIFHYTKELIGKDGELTDSHIEHIMDRFNTPRGSSYPNDLKKQILENIK